MAEEINEEVEEYLDKLGEESRDLRKDIEEAEQEAIENKQNKLKEDLL